jgi:hypothetical protein
MTTYEGVKKELYRNFGDPNEKHASERMLQLLRQKGSVQQYDTECTALAILLGRNDAALAAQFYRRLKDSVKDELAKTAHPDDYLELEQLALQIDMRTFERQIEKGDRPFPSKPSTYTSTTYANHPSNNRASSFAPRAANMPPRQTSTYVKSERMSPTPARLNAAYTQDARTRRGKLDPQEYQRRKDQNLCIYCGNAGHQATACRLAPTASLRQAQVAVTSRQVKE